MKRTKVFRQIFASLILLLSMAVLFSPSISFVSTAYAQTCVDDQDNDGDGRADWDGVPEKNLPPDPSCTNDKSVEKADDVAEGSLIPCTNKCDLAGVFGLINNVIEFLIKAILFPIIVILFVYAGYTYITSGDNPGKRVKVKKLIKHIILGMVLILTAWLIVRTVLSIIGYDQSLLFFQE